MPGFGHVAVGMAAARARAPGEWSRGRLAASMAAWGALSLAPDLDVIGFRFGVPYGSEFGHRGATHSLVAAIAGGVLVGAIASARRRRLQWKLGLAAIAVLASHGLLDAMTDGGRGVALLWPFTTARYFFALHPIPVAPIAAGMLSARGAYVTVVELVLFAPFWLWAIRPRQQRP